MTKLSKISTTAPAGLKKSAAKKETAFYAKKLGELQRVLRAQKKYSVLVILQGMDASGKDGAVKNVFKECTHHGISVYSFKKPTEEEFAHDFLWRIHKQCPKKGEIKIFNRSHYEDILIQRVHKWIDKDRVNNRIDSIKQFEKLLTYDCNTLIFKFFLHLSFEQQEIELQQRIDDPEKHWKHNENDWKEREHWDEYMRCYEDVLNRSEIPWHIIPVDQRWYRDLSISKILVERLEKLDLQFPPLEE